MAKRKSPSQNQQSNDGRGLRLFFVGLKRHIFRVVFRIVAGLVFIFLLVLFGLRIFDPPYTVKMAVHRLKIGPVISEPVETDQLPRYVKLAFIAAQDSQFCQHWGFNVRAIRAHPSEGGGASISQQLAHNLFFPSGENGYSRLVASIATLLIEIVMSKERILELYLNTHPFGGGVFGVAAAAKASINKPVEEISEEESAELAALFISNLKTEDTPTPDAKVIFDGTRLLEKDERSACIEG